jgi:triosephosphate isomerase
VTISIAGPRPWIVGNWKMNGLGSDIIEACTVAQALKGRLATAQVAICAPATLIERLARAVRGSDLIVGGEDLNPDAEGPFTGDISAEMLADAGARMVIVGHSERRAAYGETDALVSRKALAALRGGLTPIVCVGETLAERDAGRAEEVVCRQATGSLPPGLAGHAFLVAYEPIWAIGAGQPPALNHIARVHGALRAAIIAMMGRAGDDAPILYGGSVDPANAAAILGVSQVGGALVGGASLRAAEFLQILGATPAFVRQ